jgi:hypothetical protein
VEGLEALMALPHDEVMIDREVFEVLDIGSLPEADSRPVHLRQGLSDLLHGYERWGSAHLQKLPPGTAEAARARFAVLHRQVDRGGGKAADQIAAFSTLAGAPGVPPDLRNEALLMAARLDYETARYEEALDAYREVKLPSMDPGRATLYLEEAWTRYRLGQLHAAMGILTTLDAPSFRGEFVPDKYLLRAFIFRDLCYYLPAKRAAAQLAVDYGESLDTIRDRGALAEDPRLRQAALARSEVARASQHFEQISSEVTLLDQLAGDWSENVSTSIRRIYEDGRARAQRTFRRLLEGAAEEEADGLVDASEQLRLLSYEVSLKLYARRTPVEAKDLDGTFALDPSRSDFIFHGEYWNDEVRDYQFELKSRCTEKDAL